MSTVPVPLLVPALGAAGAELRLSVWLVEAGEVFAAGDQLVELLLPGITCDVAAPCAGTLQAPLKAVGTRVAEGDLLAEIHPLDSDAAA